MMGFALLYPSYELAQPGYPVGWVERQRNPSHRHLCQAPHPTPVNKLRAADYPGTKLLPA